MTEISHITEHKPMYEAMLAKKLDTFYPAAELYVKAKIAAQINKLKIERNAVILGHNYMEAALFQTIPDVVGDSLELSRKAAKTDKDIIVFCGVKFMAETAKILNPQKTVLIPARKAGCSLAESITADDVRKLKAQYPGVPVVTYVNTYADVKAETDICCTSGNAVDVVNSLNTDRIIFLPDQYLAANIARETGKKIVFPTKKPVSHEKQAETPNIDWQFLGWHGACEVHERFSVEDIKMVREQFPDVVVLAHPECPPDVVAASDYSGSTTAMIRYVEKTQAPRYLLLTECSMGDNIAAANPDKEMVRLCSIRCPHMAEITLEDTLAALQKTQYVVTVPEHIRLRAFKAVDRMIKIGGTGKKD
jgi:quinolinate synthase